MTDNEEKRLLETIAAILLRCVILSLALLYLWFAFYLLSGNKGYAIHSIWFPLIPNDYVSVNYFGMAFMKILILVFFLIPYLSVRWALRNKK
jgi:hypothetical protein